MSMITFSCPHCLRVYQLAAERARPGLRATCGRCSRSFDVESRIGQVPAPAILLEETPPSETPPPPTAESAAAPAAPEPRPAPPPPIPERPRPCWLDHARTGLDQLPRITSDGAAAIEQLLVRTGSE
jgi:hypothetical protein